MKKQVKKLRLMKETVRSLDDRNLGKVVGGYSFPQYTCGSDVCGTSAGPMICSTELPTNECP